MPPPIYFYFPDHHLPETLVLQPNKYWKQFRQYMLGSVYAWILQPYLHLRDHGFPCQLTEVIPEEGVVLSVHHLIPETFMPGPKLLLICLCADKPLHRYAQCHVLHNPRHPLFETPDPLWPVYYLNRWPQEELIPRSAKRGCLLRNVAYVGAVQNIAPELLDPEWERTLQSMELAWKAVIKRPQWNNFSWIDCVVAVRDFTSRSNYFDKSATKLHNAWQAGVPAILGAESAYRAERRSGLDYIEVNSQEQLLQALTRLRTDERLYDAMRQNGLTRALEISSEAVTKAWVQFLTAAAAAAYDGWCSRSGQEQRSFFAKREESPLLLDWALDCS